MAFARRVFQIAGIYGIIVLAPQYLLEGRIGRDNPPAITHPEYFYGFVGVALAWQFVFLLIGRDPIRYRPLMLVGVLEKLAFGPAAYLLYFEGRASTTVVFFGTLDLVLGALFVIAYLRVPASSQGVSSATATYPLGSHRDRTPSTRT